MEIFIGYLVLVTIHLLFITVVCALQIKKAADGSSNITAYNVILSSFLFPILWIMLVVSIVKYVKDYIKLQKEKY